VAGCSVVQHCTRACGAPHNVVDGLAPNPKTLNAAVGAPDLGTSGQLAERRTD
jgi:hypothetical protein